MTVATRIRNRLDRIATRRWRSRAYVAVTRPIVIGGCPRSGTTVLRLMLGTHPDIACGPESFLFLPGRPSPARLALGYRIPEHETMALIRGSTSQAEFIDAFMRRYIEQVGTRRWAEKTPMNVRHIPFLFEHFPEARFIHIIRDGRDTVCSMRVHADRRLVDGRWIRTERVRPIEPLIRRWNHDVRVGRSFGRDPRYAEIRYEELVRDPRATLERVLQFVGERFDENVLTYRRGTARARDSVHDRSIGRWRLDLSPDERETVKRIAGSLLIELGYAADDGWSGHLGA